MYSPKVVGVQYPSSVPSDCRSLTRVHSSSSCSTCTDPSLSFSQCIPHASLFTHAGMPPWNKSGE